MNTYERQIACLNYQREVEPLCNGVALTERQEVKIVEAILNFFVFYDLAKEINKIVGEELNCKYKMNPTQDEVIEAWFEYDGNRINVWELYNTFYNLIWSAYNVGV